jgi:hypothetical protein
MQEAEFLLQPPKIHRRKNCAVLQDHARLNFQKKNNGITRWIISHSHYYFSKVFTFHFQIKSNKNL